MNKSILDYNIFNAIDPNSIEPKAKKPKPFPLETIEDDIANAYKAIDVICMKLTAAHKSDIGFGPKKLKYIDSMKYKAGLCKKMLLNLSVDVNNITM